MSEQDADGTAADAGDDSEKPAEDHGEDLEDIAEAPSTDADEALSAVLGETVATDLELEEVEAHDDLVERVAEADSDSIARELAALRTRVEALQSQLEEHEAAVEDLESRLARKQADFQNYKKRQEERLEEEKARATEDLVARLLDVRDNLKRALDQDEDAEIRGGVESTLRQFEEELERENVQPIEPGPGESPDPQYHEVLMQVESDHPEGTIADVHRAGYEMAGKVLRAAQVTVSDGSGDEGDDSGEQD
jgi:molecular chaperone GrpE